MKNSRALLGAAGVLVQLAACSDGTDVGGGDEAGLAADMSASGVPVASDPASGTIGAQPAMGASATSLASAAFDDLPTSTSGAEEAVESEAPGAGATGTDGATEGETIGATGPGLGGGSTAVSPSPDAGAGGASSTDGVGGSPGDTTDEGSAGGAANGSQPSGAGGAVMEAPPETEPTAPIGMSELVGFATLNGGTTGGQGGQTVTASNYDELRTYAESAERYVILVQGTISNGPNGGELNVQSNKSLIGVGDSALLDGVGLDINNVENIIVQNLRVTLTGVTTRTDTEGVYSSTGDEGLAQILVNGGDAISIRGNSRNIWIDHCELFSEDPNVQTNKDLYDGLIDIKNETGFITISYNHFHDHHKGGLVGSSDSDLYGDRKITFYHNYYDNVKLRIPMYRGSTGHFFNNYVVGADDASEIRAGTCVRVERNYYEALHYSIYTPSDAPGSTERIDNIEIDRSSRDYPANCTADIPYDYSAVLITNTQDVKTLVPERAGVGKL